MVPFISIGGSEIETYLVLYLIAFVVATFVIRNELKRNHYPPYLYLLLVAVALISGLIGSKIYYFFESMEEFALSPVDTFFNLAGSGWYGGFILAGLSITLTLKIMKRPILKTLDLLVPVIPLGQAIGRLGCFFAGCCHGIPTALPWGLSFPDGLYSKHVKVHPTQLYEMGIYLAIFVLLWRLRKKVLRAGVKFSIYLILAGLGRFIIEFFRLNPKIMFGITFPQIISFILILMGIIMILNRRGKRSTQEKQFEDKIGDT